MLLNIKELDASGVPSNIIIQTDHISSVKETVMDFSTMCQVCLIGGERIVRHDIDWCKEHDRIDEYHPRKVGESNVPVTIISMANGDTIVAQGKLELVGVN